MIVVTAYLPYMQGSSQNSSLSLNGLRSLRVLRPLRTITSIKSLKRLISTVLEAIPTLIDIIVLLTFVFLIIAIGGLQLFSGLMLHRCVNQETGATNEDQLCGGSGYSCSDGFICSMTYINPESGIMSFDNLIYSLLMVFETITMVVYLGFLLIENSFSLFLVFLLFFFTFEAFQPK